MIADIVFDIPIDHAFSYAVPAGLDVTRGQRVSAPLHGRSRVGVVVGLREGDATALKPLQRAVEPVPVLSDAALELTRWAAGREPLVVGLHAPVPAAAARRGPLRPRPSRRPRIRRRVPHTTPELWVDHRREARLAEHLERESGAALVIAPDREAAARWARRLDAVRLDSGVPEPERRRAWFAASRGRSRVVVGTRSALLAPLPPPATLALIDEHDPAHKPPGAPRLHSRDLLLRRAALDGSRLLLLSATPSVETWWRAQDGQIARAEAAAWRPGPRSSPRTRAASCAITR